MTSNNVTDLTRLSQIGVVICMNDDGQGLSQALTLLREVLNCAAVGVWRFDSAPQQYRCVAFATKDHSPCDLVFDVDRMAQLTGSRSEALAADDAWAEASDMFPDSAWTSALPVPLYWKGAFAGILVAFDEIEHTADAGGSLLPMVAPLIAAALCAGEEPPPLSSAVLRAEDERLLRIQVSIRRMLEQDNMDANLEEAVQAIHGLGWDRVVLALFSDEGQVGRVYAAGQPYDTGEDVLPAEIWTRLVDGQLEPFRRSGLYCLYEAVPEAAAWQASDRVFGLLKAGQGEVVGIVRVDAPVDGRRPTLNALRAIDILANQTAYVIENARLLERISQSAETLAAQVEELSMIHRADRELSTHLDVDRVMRLTMDWALRRTGATTGLLMLMTSDKQGLIPSVTMGEIDYEAFPYSAQRPMPVTLGVLGRTARTGETQVLRGVGSDDALAFLRRGRAYVAAPLSMRGEPLGVIMLASDREEAFQPADVNFVERLARRAAVALDNARLFKQAEQLADDMAVVYAASRTITSTLDRDEILQRIAQAMAVALECSSAIIFDYRPETEEVQVLAIYRVGTAHEAQEILPEIKHTMSIRTFPAFREAVDRRYPVAFSLNTPSLSGLDREQMVRARIRAMVLIPLVSQDELIGVAAVTEGRHDRTFSSNDVFRVETLGGQAAVALRQSMLYYEVLELEKLKSEMIRMASHDLRNPLNNIMGYLELLAMDLHERGTSPEEELFIDNLRSSTQSMQSLLEDMLTLERIESDRKSEWNWFNLSGLVLETTEAHQSGARLKQQSLTLELAAPQLMMRGSVTQMRQAIANLIGNAIKYTPEGGHIAVHLAAEDKHLSFTVVDDGYGISPQRQARLFERFYRAREPGTDHIGGTGLGLSLVKTVIERHSGEVWFKSEPGEGSTFGFQVPTDL